MENFTEDETLKYNLNCFYKNCIRNFNHFWLIAQVRKSKTFSPILHTIKDARNIILAVQKLNEDKIQLKKQ